MTSSGDNPRQQAPPADDVPDFPQTPQEELDNEPTPDVALCRLPAGEAKLLCSHLESEGIPCAIRADDPETRPLEEGAQVEVLVFEEHLEEARALRANPPTHHPVDDLLEDEDYIKNWVCPKCHQGELEALPMTSVARWLWRTLVAIGSLPLLMMFSRWLFDDGGTTSSSSEWMNSWLVWLWLATLLTIYFNIPERVRRCTKCEWRSDPPDQRE